MLVRAFVYLSMVELTRRGGHLRDLLPVEIPGNRFTGLPVDGVGMEGGREVDACVDGAADRPCWRVKVPGECLVCRSRTGKSTLLDIELELSPLLPAPLPGISQRAGFMLI